MKFAKAHGLGNDFILVAEAEAPVERSAWAVRLCDRHRGIGGDGLILHTAWAGGRVIASIDCLWGCLDGMNEAGLAVSLSFGGRRAVGDGFGIPIVLRYVLEFCRTAADAADVLRRVPALGRCPLVDPAVAEVAQRPVPCARVVADLPRQVAAM